jgi:hypothetical protein
MNSSETEIGILAEPSWGGTPSPLTFQAIRITGESLKVNRNNIVSDEIRSDRNVSDLIQVGGSATGGIDGELSYGTFDELIESALFSAWDSDKIVNGTTQKSFHIQKKQTDGTSSIYELYKGMVVDTMTLNIASGEKTTVGFTFIGKNGTIGTSATGTTSDATTTEVLDGANAFVLNDFFVSPVPNLMSMQLTFSNNLAAKPVAGSVDLIGVRAGRCVVTGTASLYFDTKAMMDLFLAGNGGEISLTIGKVTTEKYTIRLPNVKIQDADHFSPGNDEDVMLNITFQALYDETLEGVIEFEREVA